jgi:hypothetical protein
MRRTIWQLIWGILALLLTPLLQRIPAQAAEPLPPIVFVARAHLATTDYIFRAALGPPSQLTTRIDGFAPGSKLILRAPDGALQTLIDTAQPAGHPLNPLGLKDLAAPDVSFDATRVVFAATLGPEPASPLSRPRFSWRLFERAADGRIRQLTFSDRAARIPPGPGNAEAYAYYDDLFPAYLADGRIVFSSSRYPSRAHYDGRPTFNLYLIDPGGANLQRITTERGAALHPTPLPDGRILWSRWWLNFNQPSETGIYQRIDNAPGTIAARDARGEPITIERRVTLPATAGAPASTPIPPTPTPWRPTFVERFDPSTGGIIRQTVTPMPQRAAPAATPRPAQTAAPATGAREVTVRVPVTGYRLPDGTLIYSNTVSSFLPARGRLPDGAPIRDAPNTWHLMTTEADGSDMRRFAWTPRYAAELTSDGGQDTFNAAQPAVLFKNNQIQVAYTTQRDGSMAHTSLLTGIRVARPGIASMAENTTESVAGMRWESGSRDRDGNALRPAGLPDGRILFAQSVPDPQIAQTGTFRFSRNGRDAELSLRGAALRYELRVIQPDGSGLQVVPIAADLRGYDLLDAKPFVARPIGFRPGEWQLPRAPGCQPACPAAASDDPLLWDVPRGLATGDGAAAYPWSPFAISQVKLTTLHNPNVYANPPLDAPFVNNSPPIGSVAFADIYLDAPQFTGASYSADMPDDQVRAVKWLTVPVSPAGAFTAAAPADTPIFIVLRDSQGQIVRGGNRSSLAIAQGNAPGRPGIVTQCVGCHMGHMSGTMDAQPLAQLGWTNIAPAAAPLASSGSAPERINDRRGYVLDAAGAAYQDRTASWVAGGARSEGEWVRLDWSLPVALLSVRLVGVEPGQEGFSRDYQLRGELRFFLKGAELREARQAVEQVASLSRGGTFIQLAQPVAADRIQFIVSDVQGTRSGGAAPAALAEIEVIGQGATPQALASRPVQVSLPNIGR